MIVWDVWNLQEPTDSQTTKKTRKIDHVSSRWSCHRGLVIGMCNDAPANDGLLFRGTFFCVLLEVNVPRSHRTNRTGTEVTKMRSLICALEAEPFALRADTKKMEKKPWPRARVSRMILPISPAGRVLFLQQHHAPRDSSLNCPSLPLLQPSRFDVCRVGAGGRVISLWPPSPPARLID